MLQPRSYPKRVGQALVLEGEPFIEMADDDDPWLEGLFLVVMFGVAIGLARFVGGLLLTLTLPPTDALLEAAVLGWRQIAGVVVPLMEPSELEALLRQQWPLLAAFTGFGGGWVRLLVILYFPVLFLTQWLFFGLVAHGTARLVGGNARLSQTLGVTALMVAPQTFLFLTIVPFVSVSGPMIGVWSLLIGYRGIQIAHELTWQRAAWVTLLPPLLLTLLAGTGLSIATIFMAWAGG